MVPVLSPGFSSSSSSLVSPPPLSQQMSSSSVHSIAELLVASSSRLSDSHIEVVREEGLRHAKIKLDASLKSMNHTNHGLYKKPQLKIQLLEVLRKLKVPLWSTAPILPEDIDIRKVSGALTNAVFFVSLPSLPTAKTLLLRVYGSSSGSLISRPRELHILHVLSSRYKIGPRVYGTFDNGRIEEFFDSVTLTSSDIRDPQISRWIAARMAELHCVDIEAVGGSADPQSYESLVNVSSWLAPAEEVLALPGVSDATRQEYDIKRFKEEWAKFNSWVLTRPRKFGTRRVFAHNDAQYGNLLRLKDGTEEGIEEHRQIIVVDFEYAGPNPAAFDIANHFFEWCANYHGPTPHLLDATRYPSWEERRNFYLTYIRHSYVLADDPDLGDKALEAMAAELDKDVFVWGAASHAQWAVWGLVQAREDIEAGNTEPEFDYIGYANGRMASFRTIMRSFNL